MSLFMIVNAKIWRPIRETKYTWLKIPKTRCLDFLKVFHWRKLKIKKILSPKEWSSNFRQASIVEIISHVGYRQKMVYRLCLKTIFHEDYFGKLHILSHIHHVKFWYKESPLWLQASTIVSVACCRHSSLLVQKSACCFLRETRVERAFLLLLLLLLHVSRFCF